MPAGSFAPARSFSGVADALHSPVPATYVRPAGRASVICRFVAGTVPELVYDSVTVIAARPGEGPLVTDSALVTVITEAATVVVSVLLPEFEPVSVAATVMVAVS